MSTNNDQDWKDAWDSPDEIDPMRKRTLLQGIQRKIAHQRRNRRIFFIGGAAAAAVVLFIFFRAGIFATQPDVSRWPLLSSVDTPRKLLLEDGSTVWLAPHSAVRVHPGFTRHRDVAMASGTALFSVVKDQAHAFSVGVGAQRVTVLGTAFIIDQLDSADMRLSVKEGKVALDNSGGRRLLVAGQQVVTTHALTGVTQQLDTRYLGWWQERQTEWHNVTMKVLLDNVESYYHVRLSRDSIQQDIKITLTWDRTMTLQENLSVLKTLTRYNIKICNTQN